MKQARILFSQFSPRSNGVQRGLGLATIAVLMLSVLTACAPSQEAPGGAPQDSSAAAPSGPKLGGVLHIGSIQEPDSIYPYTNTLAVGTDVADLVFDSLIKLDEQGNYQPSLATEVPTVQNGGVTPDGLKYTFKLRQGVKWHDGKPFTSADVKFTWQSVLDPKFPVGNRVTWNKVTSVDTPDQNTAVVTLKELDVTFPYNMATAFVIPAHIVEKPEQIPTSQYFRKPIGTGPFKFAEWQSGSFIRLEKNPDYWEPGKPYLAGIVYETIPSTEGLLSKLERGELHLRLALNFQDQEVVRKFRGFKVITTPSYSVWNFRYQGDDPIVGDVLVRRALAYATNKKEITQGILGGLAQPLYTWVSEPHWAHNANVEKYEFNPAKAKELLDQAGWKDPGDGGPRIKDGKKLSLKIRNIAGDVERLKVVQVVQQQWKAVGIESEIVPIQAAAFGQVMEEDFQIAYNWAGTDFEATNTYWLRQPRNWPRYKNDEAFALMKKANTILDREQRKKIHFQWQEMLAKDQPELWMYTRTFFDAVHNTLQNYKPIPWNRMLWNAEEWWLNN